MRGLPDRSRRPAANLRQKTGQLTQARTQWLLRHYDLESSWRWPKIVLQQSYVRRSLR